MYERRHRVSENSPEGDGENQRGNARVLTSQCEDQDVPFDYSSRTLHHHGDTLGIFPGGRPVARKLGRGYGRDTGYGERADETTGDRDGHTRHGFGRDAGHGERADETTGERDGHDRSPVVDRQLHHTSKFRGRHRARADGNNAKAHRFQVDDAEALHISVNITRGHDKNIRPFQPAPFLGFADRA